MCTRSASFQIIAMTHHHLVSRAISIIAVIAAQIELVAGLPLRRRRETKDVKLNSEGFICVLELMYGMVPCRGSKSSKTKRKQPILRSRSKETDGANKILADHRIFSGKSAVCNYLYSSFKTP